MRISDWSSDVCSSDLDPEWLVLRFPDGFASRQQPRRRQLHAHRLPHDAACERYRSRHQCSRPRVLRRRLGAGADRWPTDWIGSFALDDAWASTEQMRHHEALTLIGRASARDWVVEYV